MAVPTSTPDRIGFIGSILDLASDAGIGIDLHIDETLDPSELDIRELARQCRTEASNTGWQPATA